MSAKFEVNHSYLHGDAKYPSKDGDKVLAILERDGTRYAVFKYYPDGDAFVSYPIVTDTNGNESCGLAGELIIENLEFENER